MNAKKYTIGLLFFLIMPVLSNGQVAFQKVTDPDNEITSQPGIPSYLGASWIDYDSDNDLDLFVNSNNLYRNDGNGVFVKVEDSGIGGIETGLGNGNTWGDIDNDGDLDFYRSNMTSDFFLNTGGEFELISNGDIGVDTIKGWSCAWGDYDSDGYLDLIVSHPAGFLGSDQKNALFHNNGDGRFTRVYNTPITDEFAAFTIATWTDYDQDGDLDLFFGSGEVSFLSTDHIYVNQLMETDSAYFIKLEDSPIATDLHDGQNWNWIDIDNDGDLDGFITNYNPGVTNDLYRNDNGTYVRMTESSAGAIVADAGRGLSNLWEDFDNDGDIDCFVTFDTGMDKYYLNDGSGFFTSDTAAFTISGPTRGATAADYDGDGFQDLFVTSASTFSVGLYHNLGNENNWISVHCIGNISNRSAIGAKVMVKAEINGTPTWQIREVNSQNSFNGMSSLYADFGLGDADSIDSLMVIWPMNDTSYLTDVMVNQLLTIEEDIPMGFLRANFKLDSLSGLAGQQIQFHNLSVYSPDDEVSFYWDFNNDGIIDSEEENPEHAYSAPGYYSIMLIAENSSGTDTIVREDYIEISGFVGLNDNNERGLEFKIFPNPFHDEFTLERSEINGSNLWIEVSDLNGRSIYQKPWSYGSSELMVNLPREKQSGGQLLLTVYKAEKLIFSTKIIRY